MKELSFNVSQFPFNQIKCETAAIRQGAVVVPMGQLEIILSVQAIFTAHAFQQSLLVTGRGVQTFRPLVSHVWHDRQVGKSEFDCGCRWIFSLPLAPRSAISSLGSAAFAPDMRSTVCICMNATLPIVV